MKNGNSAVRKLRGLMLQTIHPKTSSVLSLWNNIHPVIASLGGPELASVTFSVQQLVKQATHVPEYKRIREQLFADITQNFNQKTLLEMSIEDISRFLSAFGFLVKEFGFRGNYHSRIVDLCLARVAESDIPPSCIMRLIKGVHMCRIPVSDNLILLFNRIDIDYVNRVDEKVFVVRAMVDYGLVDYEKIEKVLKMNDFSSLSPTTASSLIYTCAVSNFCPAELSGALLRVFQQCDPGVKFLTSLWSLEILELLGEDIRQSAAYSEAVKRGLESQDQRDVQMAATISGTNSDRIRVALKQSTRHTKLIGELEKDYGQLVHEFPVTPLLVVDAASVGQKMAIEINGPSHYLLDTRTGDYVLNGPTRYKESRLRELGWKVERIETAHTHKKQLIR